MRCFGVRAGGVMGVGFLEDQKTIVQQKCQAHPPVSALFQARCQHLLILRGTVFVFYRSKTAVVFVCTRALTLLCKCFPPQLTSRRPTKLSVIAHFVFHEGLQGCPRAARPTLPTSPSLALPRQDKGKNRAHIAATSTTTHTCSPRTVRFAITALQEHLLTCFANLVTSTTVKCFLKREASSMVEGLRRA